MSSGKKTRMKTTIRGEAPVGERAGRASFLLGVAGITFHRATSDILGFHHVVLVIAVVTILLGFISSQKGFRTGGTTGIVLGVLMLYFNLGIASRVTKLVKMVQIGGFELIAYVLVILTAFLLWYVFSRPKKVIRERKMDVSDTGSP